jgi:hypothetical protein
MNTRQLNKLKAGAKEAFEAWNELQTAQAAEIAKLKGEHEAVLVDPAREAGERLNAVKVALLHLPDFADLTTREDLMEAVEGRDFEAAEFLWCLSGRTVRVRSGGDNYANTILDYTEALPDDVKPMLVLDASAAVRTTYTQQEKHRKDLKFLPGSGLKKYRNVTFHVLDRGGGKVAFRNHYEEYLAAIGEVINQAPGKVLAVHFNDLPSFRADLHRFLTEETRAAHEKIQCLTWGRHDATNEYRECTTVILAGTPFYRSSQYEALGRAAAAKRAPEEYPKPDQEDIALGELRHHVLQAASRGSLRLCNVDQAKTCDVWLITDPRNGLREELETIFPEVEVVDWDAAEHLRIVQRRLSSQAMAVAEVVQEWVDNTKPTDPPLFFTDIRKRLGIKDISNFNKLVASKGFQTFLDEVGLLVRTVLNRKAFLRPTMFDLCYEYWFNLNTDFDALEARLYELKEAGVDEGPEYERVYERFIDVATQLGLAH